MAWLYALELVDSNSGSDSPSQDYEPWLTLSGKPSRRPLSWHGWRTRPWIALLSGTISQPSTAARGVAAWISSLQGSLASQPPTLGSAEAPPTSAGSGLSSPGFLAMYDPGSCSWRTSQASLLSTAGEGSERFSGRWPRSGTVSSGTVSARPRSGHPTSASASLSSLTYSPDDQRGVAWPTPDVTTQTQRGGSNGPVGRRRPMLAKAIESWPRNARPLNEIAEHWPWRTPTDQGRRGGAMDPEARAASGSMVNLQDQAAFWATPLAMDGVKPSAGNRRSDDLSHQAQEHSTSGPQSSQPTRRLNPLFVEWLMGWPRGWTASGSLVTGSFRSWLELHSWLLHEGLA